MRLRKLEEKDALLMLEWMHDDSVLHFMHADFASKTIDDCMNFITTTQDESENLHLAIVDYNDEYTGTVSLKKIHDGLAEFAITIRKRAMGKGYSLFGKKEIIKKGKTMSLDHIFWCVSKENKRAIRLYDKNGYSRIEPSENFRGVTQRRKSLACFGIWYRISCAPAFLHGGWLT